MGSKKRTSKTNKQKKTGIFKWICRFFSVLFMLVVFTCIIIGAVYGRKLMEYNKQVKRLLDEKGIEIFSDRETSTIYDTNGQVLLNMSGGHSSYYLKYEEIPQIVIETFIASEDRSFYKHKGIDIKGIMRAMVALIKNEGEVKQGGSTITQQLARNIYLSYEVSVERKIKEMFIAAELEKRYTKNQIMEFYVNNIYFANGYYGIEAAARGYFNKSARELTEEQLIFLCAIPNNPTVYDPFDYFENTLFRKDLLIDQLVSQKKIDDEYGFTLKSQEIILSPAEFKRNNYVDTYVRYCATVALMESRGFKLQNRFDNREERDKYTERFNKHYGECNSLLYKGGYNIYTTIDLELQSKLQEIVDSQLSGEETKNSEGIYAFQGSSVCIDNSNGKVVAIVGGRTADYNGYTLNRAYQSYRQPGSTIKPILVYTPAFEMGYFPETIVIDEKFQGGPKNTPNTYSGAITIKEAVAKSKNTIAWKIFERVKPQTAFTYLYKMGFDRIVKEDYQLSAALGGMTYGVSSEEMAAGYGAIANEGVYRNPSAIRYILDKNGKMIYEGENPNDDIRIYDENAARKMTSCLQEVLRNGTGKRYQVKNAICAGKTGTTNNNYDKWFVGYSRYYTLSVWIGYDLPKTIPESVKDKAGEIWQEMMTYLHRDKAKLDFKDYTTEGYHVENETEIGDTSNSTEDESTGAGSYEDESTGAGSYEGESTGAGSYEGEINTGGSYEGEIDTGGSYEGEINTGGSYEGEIDSYFSLY